MRKQKYVAVTGGIGSGKSTLCSMLKSKGYPVFSCDEIYKQVIVSPDFVAKIEKAFPSAVQNGKIDRKTLSEIVFDDEGALATLNALSHPAVMENLKAEMQKSESEVVFAEVPLLFEGNYQKRFDFVLIVEREEDSRISAVVKRDDTTKEAVLKRIASQIDHSKIASSDAVFKLNNDGDLQGLENRLDDFLDKIQ